MTSQGRVSQAYARLHSTVQATLWRWGWNALRPAQERSIPLLARPDGDVLISAPTASGKTEAATLPIVSNLLTFPPEGPGSPVLYLAPTKALINDQTERLVDLCDQTPIAVHKRHGDVSDRDKKRWLRDPQGIVLTTPESLEALFVLRGSKMPVLFGELRYVIIDELHAFVGTERGAQLQSLQGRLDRCLGRRPVRVGLSATLGDMRLAASQLAPDRPQSVTLIDASVRSPDITITVHGIVESHDLARGCGSTGPSALAVVCLDLMSSCAGSHSLVFANSRQLVEEVSDRLGRLAERAHMPAQFLPHHGSLSRELREHAEAALKNPYAPATVVATTTLEMGIDVGAIELVSQLGPPPSVASLRQRLGRSGRRGTPAVLAVYCTENEVTSRSPLDGQLRTTLVQATAVIDLLLDGWCEPPELGALHTSTLIQQLLSVIAQYGGITAGDAYGHLCHSGGPFRGTSKDRFRRLLIALAGKGVIEQQQRLLILGPEGERIVSRYDFFAAFATPVEYRFSGGGQLIGAKPVTVPLFVDDLTILGGRRWRIVAVDHASKHVVLAPSAGGTAPSFGGDAPEVHDVVRTRMRTILTAADVPTYLDEQAAELLRQGRSAYTATRLDRTGVLSRGRRTLLVPWTGTRTTRTLALMLEASGMDCSVDGLTVTCLAPEQDVREHLALLCDQTPPSGLELAKSAKPGPVNKYDRLLTSDLLEEDFAARDLNVPAAVRAAHSLLHPEAQA